MDAARICDLNNGISVEETAVTWNDGESYTLAVDFIRGQKPPIRNFMATMSVKEQNGGSLAKIEAQYTPKFGPVGAVMDVMMIRNSYSKLLAGVLDGLKHYAETGEVVDTSVLKRVKTSAAPA